MRIVMFITAYKSIISGVITALITFRQALMQRGHDVYVFAPLADGQVTGCHGGDGPDSRMGEPQVDALDDRRAVKVRRCGAVERVGDTQRPMLTPSARLLCAQRAAGVEDDCWKWTLRW